MKKCLTCKHWEKDKRVGGPQDLYRQCKKTLFEDLSWAPYEPKNKESTAYVVDGSGYWAGLFTRPEHGCTMHEQIDRKTK